LHRDQLDTETNFSVVRKQENFNIPILK